jgi:hypothetical protein
MTTTYVCSVKDIECGSKPENWCSKCPLKLRTNGIKEVAMSKLFQLSNVGGVWSPPWFPALSWGVFPIVRLELIADDHTYQFKTTEQKYNPECKRSYL